MKKCHVTGKRVTVGHKVSHANNKTKRTFAPNLQVHRFWSEAKKCFIKLRVTARGIRTIDKLGVDAVLEKLKKCTEAC